MIRSMSLYVLRKMKSRLARGSSRSQSCLKSLMRSSIGKSPKFMLPMFSEHSSGLNVRAASVRSSTVMPWPPPVVMLITASVWGVDRAAGTRAKSSGSGVGAPVSGSRACRWTIAAPACAAPIALVSDLVRRDREVRGHRGHMDRARDRAADDDLASAHAIPSEVGFEIRGRAPIAAPLMRVVRVCETPRCEWNDGPANPPT